MHGDRDGGPSAERTQPWQCEQGGLGPGGWGRTWKWGRRGGGTPPKPSPKPPPTLPQHGGPQGQHHPQPRPIAMATGISANSRARRRPRPLRSYGSAPHRALPLPSSPPPPPFASLCALRSPHAAGGPTALFPTSLRDARGPSTPLLRSPCAPLYDPRDGTAPPLPPRYSAVPPLHGAALSPLPPLYPPPSSTSL